MIWRAEEDVQIIPRFWRSPVTKQRLVRHRRQDGSILIGNMSYLRIVWALSVILVVSLGHASAQQAQSHEGRNRSSPFIIRRIGDALLDERTAGSARRPVGTSFGDTLCSKSPSLRCEGQNREFSGANTTRRSLRVVFWNIERGLSFEQIRAALSGPAEFERIAQLRSGLGEARKKRIDQQLLELEDADVVVLNEVDWGMKRTDYRDVAKD